MAQVQSLAWDLRMPGAQPKNKKSWYEHHPDPAISLSLLETVHHTAKLMGLMDENFKEKYLRRSQRGSAVNEPN